MVWRFPLLSLLKKGSNTGEAFEKKVKELHIEPEKMIKSNDDMPVDLEADLVPEKKSTESEVDANYSPKEPVERGNSNKIEVNEDTRNKENITVIVAD